MRWDFKRKKLKVIKSSEPVYRNPMFPKRTWQLFIIERLSLFSLGLLLIVLVVIYIFFYSSIFAIKNVNIKSTENIPVEIIKKNYVDWQMSQSKLFILRQSNIFLFSRSWLKKNISQKFDPQELKITKKLPDTLQIEIKEKTPSIVWVTQDKYYYLEQNGIASQEANKDKLMIGLPQINDESNADLKVGEQIIKKEVVQFILDLKEKIPQETGLNITSFSMPTRMSQQINVKTEKGFVIYFDPQRDTEAQVGKLKRTINELLKNKLDSIQYIDLRMEDRVYYK